LAAEVPAVVLILIFEINAIGVLGKKKGAEAVGFIPFQGYVPFLHALHVESHRWDGTGFELEPWTKLRKLPRQEECGLLDREFSSLL